MDQKILTELVINRLEPNLNHAKWLPALGIKTLLCHLLLKALQNNYHLIKDKNLEEIQKK